MISYRENVPMTDISAPASLPLRPFGQTGLQVTAICLGCAPLSSMPDAFYPVPEEQAFDLLRTTFKSPIHFLDTSAGYGDGESERRIGVVLKELGGLPADYVLETKADRDSTSGDFSGEQTRRSVERSLRLLGLDRLDIVHIHDPEYATTTFEEMMAPGGAVDVLHRYKAEGVIRAVGIAGGPIDLMTRFVETGAFDAVLTHNRYTLITRSANSLLDAAASRGMAVLNAAVYGGGMLAKGPDAWSKFAYREASPQLVECVRQMDALCRRYNVPLAAAALQRSLRDPRITSTIVGMTRPERVVETVALAQHPIPDELWPQLDEIARSAEIQMN
jgi:D-threo-aldose 1-dehydrogenase